MHYKILFYTCTSLCALDTVASQGIQPAMQPFDHSGSVLPKHMLSNDVNSVAHDVLRGANNFAGKFSQLSMQDIQNNDQHFAMLNSE